MTADEREEALFLEMTDRDQREYIGKMFFEDRERAMRLVELRKEQRKHRVMNARARKHDDPKSRAAGDFDND